jgi:predicted nucleotidyltransferase
MNSEKVLDGFVSRLRDAADANLESVILYGSATSGDFRPGLSDLNIFCVLRDTSFSALQALEPAAKWWDSQKQPAPLVMTREELERSADVFAIEWIDMRESHRVLYGSDVLANLQIPMHLHRVQVEYELREKLILLRQGFLLASGSDKKIWELTQRSAPSFSTLFRHALIALGEKPSASKAEMIQMLAKRAGFDPTAITEVLELRQRKASPGDVKRVCARYLAAIEHVTAAVDRMMDSQHDVPRHP